MRRPSREAALVLLAVAVAYGNSLVNGFAYDDVPLITRNAIVTGPGSASQIWLGPYWPSFGEYLGLYRPLAIASYAAQWALAGGAPWLFHVVCVALHAAVSLLVLTLLRSFASRGAATLGAIVFAVHPVHTEAVANVVGQAELMSAAAVVGACCIWLSSHRWRVPAVALLYLLGILAKEHAIVLPGLLVAIDAARGAARPFREYVRRTWRGLATLAAVALAVLSLRVAVIGSILGGNAGPSLPFLRGEGRLLAALRVWPEYARLMFFPADLSADYSPAVILPPDGWSPTVVLGALILLGTVALALATVRHPRAGLPAAWFLIAVLPVSNLLFPIGVLLAERTLYLPSVAIAFAAAHAWDALAAREPARVRSLALAATVVVALLAFRTVLRNPAWKSPGAWAETLYTEHPESYRAQWAVAEASITEGDTAAAIDHYQLGYRLWPYDPGFLTGYGRFLLSIGAIEPAVNLLRTAREAVPFSARIEASLADAYIAAGDGPSALEVAARLEALGEPAAAGDIRDRVNSQLQTGLE